MRELQRRPELETIRIWEISSVDLSSECPFRFRVTNHLLPEYYDVEASSGL